MASDKPAPLLIHLLGPMQVLVHGEPLPHLRSRKSLWLLALLVLRAGRPVERTWLAGTLWPDVLETKAATNLRVVLNELRNALGDQGVRVQSPNRKVLFLDLAGVDVDVTVFDAAIVRADLSAMKDAAALYRGSLLEGCTEEWAAQERILRERKYLVALQALADDALASADYETAATQYRKALSLDPLAEEAQRGLMAALSQSGDTNGALHAYQTYVRLLRKDDPRAVPNAETSAVYTRLRTGVRRRASAPAMTVAEEAAGPEVRGYLPRPLTDLVGREDERMEVAALLRRTRLVTLTGPGGIGKTRLVLEVATEAAPEFADGAWLVTLEALSHAAELVGQIAAVFGAKEEPGRPHLESLTDFLRSKRLLLILDNCEHLLEEAARVASHLLRECPGIRILATSREALGITGETAWSVPGLAVPDPDHLPIERAATLVRVLSGYDSVQLFVERAQAIQKSFSLSRQNALAIARVCARLEGIPLALELAAARVRVLTVEQIEARLDDHLGLLTGGSRTAMPRHQTLRAALDWSYDLLNPLEQLVLGRLSVFVGGCDLEAAEHVCAGDGVEASTVLDLLTSLIDKSLVVFVKLGDGADGRYRLLETVRQYAGERLEASGDALQIKRRHCDWYLALAEEAEPHLTGPNQQSWLRRLSREQNNLRSALEWSATDTTHADSPETGLRLANALWQFWQARGYYSEGRRYLETALRREREQAEKGESGVSAAVRAKAMGGLAGLAYRQGDHGTALALYEESLPLCREIGDQPRIAKLMNNLAVVWSHQGDYTKARRLYEESLEIRRLLRDKSGIAMTLGNLGNTTRAQGDLLSAREMYEDSLRLYTELGDKRKIHWALMCLANICLAQGDHRAARSLAEEGLILAREGEENPLIAESLITLGTLFTAQNDPKAAQPYFEESLLLTRLMGNRPILAWTLLGLGETLRSQAETAAAREMYTEALVIFRETGERRGEGWALLHLGNLALDAGDFAGAQALCQQSRTILHTIGDKEGVARCLSSLATALLMQDKPVNATRLFAASAALCEKHRFLVSPKERKGIDRSLDRARLSLGEAAFADAWEEGQSLTWAQVG